VRGHGLGVLECATSLKVPGNSGSAERMSSDLGVKARVGRQQAQHQEAVSSLAQGARATVGARRGAAKISIRDAREATVFYNLIKDFQPIIAALIALIAAAIAYRSTQKAARTQSTTAFTIQKQQFQDAKAKEADANRRRELATIIRLQMKFELMNVLLSDRLTWVEEVENQCMEKEQTGLYVIPDNFLIWTYFIDARSIIKEAEVYNARDQDLENLEPSYQVIYHSLHRLVSNYDKSHADAVTLAEANNPKTIYLPHVKHAIEDAVSFIQKNDLELARRVSELSD